MLDLRRIMVVVRGAVCSLVLAVASSISSCGGAPPVAAPTAPTQDVDLSPAAWEAAARKVEWNREQRIIRCLGTDTTVTVPADWISHVEIHSEGDVRIRPGRDADGVLLVRAKADEFTLDDFARDFVDALGVLVERPPNEATITFESTQNGQMGGLLTTAPETLAAEDPAFRYRYAVVQRSQRSCRIFALAAVPSTGAKGDSGPMLRLAESVSGSSLGEMVGRFTFRTLGQIVGASPNPGGSRNPP